jgi:hypothetical protein
MNTISLQVEPFQLAAPERHAEALRHQLRDRAGQRAEQADRVVGEGEAWRW